MHACGMSGLAIIHALPNGMLVEALDVLPRFVLASCFSVSHETHVHVPLVPG